MKDLKRIIASALMLCLLWAGAFAFDDKKKQNPPPKPDKEIRAPEKKPPPPPRNDNNKRVGNDNRRGKPE